VPRRKLRIAEIETRRLQWGCGERAFAHAFVLVVVMRIGRDRLATSVT